MTSKTVSTSAILNETVNENNSPVAEKIPVTLKWLPESDEAPSVILLPDGQTRTAQEWAEEFGYHWLSQSRTGKTGQATIFVPPESSLWAVSNAWLNANNKLRVGKLALQFLWSEETEEWGERGVEVWGTALRWWSREAWRAAGYQGLFLLVKVTRHHEGDEAAFYVVEGPGAWSAVSVHRLPVWEGEWKATVLTGFNKPTELTLHYATETEESVGQIGWRVLEWLAYDYAEMREDSSFANIRKLSEVDKTIDGQRETYLDWELGSVKATPGWYRRRYGILTAYLPEEEPPYDKDPEKPWSVVYDDGRLRILVRPRRPWEGFGDFWAMFVDREKQAWKEVLFPWAEWPRITTFWAHRAIEVGVESYHFDYEWAGIEPVGPFPPPPTK